MLPVGGGVRRFHTIVMYQHENFQIEKSISEFSFVHVRAFGARAKEIRFITHAQTPIKKGGVGKTKDRIWRSLKIFMLKLSDFGRFELQN